MSRPPADLLDWASGLDGALRAGELIPDALRQSIDVTTVGSDVVLPVGAHRAVAELAHGRMMRSVLLDWRQRSTTTDERLVVTALLVASEQGARACEAVDVVVDRLRDRRFIDSRRRVLTAQARATAAVLVLLPLVFVGLTSLLRRDVPFAGRGGLVVLVAGVALDGLGYLWMRNLRRRWL